MEKVPRSVSGESSWISPSWEYEVAFPSRSGLYSAETKTMIYNQPIEVQIHSVSSHKQLLWERFFRDQTDHDEDTI